MKQSGGSSGVKNLDEVGVEILGINECWVAHELLQKVDVGGETEDLPRRKYKKKKKMSKTASGDTRQCEGR